MDRTKQLINLINNSDVLTNTARLHEQSSRSSYSPAKVKPRQPFYENQHKAMRAVVLAVRLGLLVKADSCAEEGVHSAVGKLEAHHYLGYAPEHWLDVKWLCQRHHSLADRSGD